MSEIPEFTMEELMRLETRLAQRYGKPVPFELADVELALDANSEQLIACPAVVWEENGAGFVVCKTGAGRYRARLYYGEDEQYDTGRVEYDDFSDCVLTLLRVQADHDKERQGVTSGKTGIDLQQ
ncbi:MAG: hypothetical protein ACREUA_03450 [Burkholderiales bacterium]